MISLHLIFSSSHATNATCIKNVKHGEVEHKKREVKLFKKKPKKHKPQHEIREIRDPLQQTQCLLAIVSKQIYLTNPTCNNLIQQSNSLIQLSAWERFVFWHGWRRKELGCILMWYKISTSSWYWCGWLLVKMSTLVWCYSLAVNVLFTLQKKFSSINQNQPVKLHHLEKKKKNTFPFWVYVHPPQFFSFYYIFIFFLSNNEHKWNVQLYVKPFTFLKKHIFI